MCTEVDHEPSTCMYIVITTEWCPKYVILGWGPNIIYLYIFLGSALECAEAVAVNMFTACMLTTAAIRTMQYIYMYMYICGTVHAR